MLVRALFGLNPDELTDNQFVELWTEAAWLEYDRNLRLAKTLAQLLGATTEE